MSYVYTKQPQKTNKHFEAQSSAQLLSHRQITEDIQIEALKTGHIETIWVEVIVKDLESQSVYTFG